MAGKTKSKGHDYSTMLIWSAAIVTVVRYAAAFIASDVGEIVGWLSEVISVLMGLSGLGMGILDVFGGAYLFDGWRRTMPAAGKKWSFKFKALTGFVFSLIGTGVLILVPFTVSRVTHTSMAAVLSNLWLLFGWSFLVNIAPYLLIGGVSVGNQIVTVSFRDDGKVTGNFPQEDGKLSGKFPNDWRKARKLLTGDQVQALAVDETANICYHFGIDARTARNWRKYAQVELNKE